MKRIANLFSRICDRGTFSIAANRAARGKRTRSEVKRFLAHADHELNSLVAKLRNDRFRFAAYREFYVRDPKTRLIHAPQFRDRVVHHAMLHVLGPVLELGAIDQSYACRAGRGQHAAVKLALRWSRTDRWFLKLDVEKFYDSVNHEILLHLLRRRFREESVLRLFRHLLDSYSTLPGRGLPIGALTSQYLGNFYLDVVDRWMKQQMKVARYLRYMDDMLLIGTHSELKRVLEQVETFLQTLDLKLNPNFQLNRCDLGIPLLGFVVYPNRIRLNCQARKRIRHKMHGLERAFQRQQIAEQELQERMTSIFQHAAFADDSRWRKTVCQFSRT